MFRKKHPTFCLFCGSQYGDFKGLAEKLNAFAYHLCKEGYRIIFGGGQQGLMGEVYKGASRCPNRHLTGVPFFSFLHEVKRKKSFNKLLIAKTLGRRKDIFVQKADVFVILPGAAGTVDEYFHTLVLSAYGMMDKPSIIVNIDGYWNPLIELTFQPLRHHLMTSEMLKHIYVVDSLDDVLDCFLNKPQEKTLKSLYEKQQKH